MSATIVPKPAISPEALGRVAEGVEAQTGHGGAVEAHPMTVNVEQPGAVVASAPAAAPSPAPAAPAPVAAPAPAPAPAPSVTVNVPAPK